MMTVMNLCSLEFQIPISFFTQTVNEKTVQNLCSDPQTWLNWPSWPESPKSPGSQQWADFTGDQIDFTDLDNSNMDKHIFYHFINKIFQKGFINKDETIHHREIAQKSRYIPLLSSVLQYCNVQTQNTVYCILSTQSNSSKEMNSVEADDPTWLTASPDPSPHQTDLFVNWKNQNSLQEIHKSSAF